MTVARNPDDQFPYPTWPRLETHPDRLAAVALLHGLRPAPVDACRVLEIGCGDGGNLVPMAHALPGSRFTGIDLAGAPIAEARRAVRELRLRNVELIRADLASVELPRASFDYVIAHGVYSWVPEPVRDALLALCRRVLAPGGVALVSYNTYPGRHIREMLREMLRYHTTGRPALEEARSLLAFLRDHAGRTALARSLMAAEAAAMLTSEPASLVHDDLAKVNQAVYFHQFAAHAARHRLQYLDEAQVHEGMHGPAIGRDRIARQQYLDFGKLRRFRQTLLCRAEERPAAAASARRLARLWFSSPARVTGNQLEGVNGIRITGGDPVVMTLCRALSAAWPRPVPFTRLRGLDPAAREIVFSLLSGGFVEPHAWGFPAAEAGEYPRGSAVARRDAARGPRVTNLCHRQVELDAPSAELLVLLDGRRDRAALAVAWRHRGLGAALDRLARLALLETTVPV